MLKLRREGLDEGEADFAASVDRIDTLTKLAAEKKRKHEEKKSDKKAGKVDRAAVAGAHPGTSIQASIQAGIVEAEAAAKAAAAAEEEKRKIAKEALSKLTQELNATQRTESQKLLDRRWDQYVSEEELLHDSLKNKLILEETYQELNKKSFAKYSEDVAKINKDKDDKIAASDKRKQKAIEDAADEQITATANVFSALEF